MVAVDKTIAHDRVVGEHREDEPDEEAEPEARECAGERHDAGREPAR